MCVIACTGGALATYMGYDFLKTTVGLILIQLTLGYVVNTVMDYYTAVKNKSLENERLKLYSIQSAELKCAFCGEISVVPIRLDTENEYVCPSCGKRNSVYLNITVARSTTPMNVNPLTTSMINDEEEEILEQIQGNE